MDVLADLQRPGCGDERRYVLGLPGVRRGAAHDAGPSAPDPRRCVRECGRGRYRGEMTRMGRVVEEIVERAYRYASWSLTGRGLTRMPPVRWTTNVLHRYFEARSTGRTYGVNGFTMVLPPSDVELGIRGFSERFVTDYFRRTVHRGLRAVA